MLTVKEAKEFLRLDGSEEDALIASLILTSKTLVEDIIRESLDLEKELPEPICQAMLILIATFYEERQISKSSKEGLSVDETLNMIRRMLFGYRKEKF